VIHHGDALEVMAGMEPESVDAVVTDPPYGLEFMGKEWDRLWHTDATRERTTGRQSTKPTDLMRHLVRLVTPPGGTVLDPFLGSGTTGIACELEGFPWIGIEREAEYCQIAEARLYGVQKGLGLAV
jgi:DNA modification methylase